MATDLEARPAPRLESPSHLRAAARYAIQQINWQWLDGLNMMRTRDENRTMAALMLAVYLAHLKGRKISKTDACAFMHVDAATTAPRYFDRLEECGFVLIERKPAEDRRRDFLIPNAKLIEHVELELTRLLPPAIELAEGTQTEAHISGRDSEGLDRVPPGEPEHDLWPPSDVGFPLKPGKAK